MRFSTHWFWWNTTSTVVNGLVSLFNDIWPCGLFSVKAILVEEQLWKYLTNSCRDKGIHTFPEGTSPKIDIITWLDLELAYYDIASCIIAATWQGLWMWKSTTQLHRTRTWINVIVLFRVDLRVMAVKEELYIPQSFRTRALFIFTNPSARAGYDTRSIFKQSLTGLNSEFSFS